MAKHKKAQRRARAKAKSSLTSRRKILPKKSLAHKIALLLVAIIISEIVGNLGAPIAAYNIPTWYAALNKSPFTPPTWVFGPVWALLYLLMGVSLYLIWEKHSKQNHLGIPLKLFGIQLSLNLFWILLFFGYHSTLWGLIVIMALWISIIATMISFWSISRNAALLLVPYLIWVSFATVLSFSIWFLN